ncbi:MAG: hypothetical protein FJW20_27355 [Acidimicrobiia bacterium]|nr:hypothetical protein [Acidimicrobiia bacterium]
MPSSTTSVRLRDDLSYRLEEASRRSKKGKNRIITEALEAYLNKLERRSIAAEARRQSIAASQSTSGDADSWARHMDRRGWS